MGLIVETGCGRIEGVEEGGVEVFRGIPYAASTAGAGRWRPPAPREPWSGVREARRPGPMAPQAPGLISKLLGDSGLAMDEDCLSLDVWTPSADAARRPVLVWIHGGSFNTGSGSLAVYDGGVLARRGDVVVVTLNYRLGALGFLPLPELAREEGGAPGNFGLLDQIAALEWVRDNIAAFGGDPDQVTLFGQSAGAMCAATLVGTPRARGLFQRVILQSGAAQNVHAPETAERVSAAFLAELGVGAGDVATLRALPVGALLEAQGRTLERLRREIGEVAFQPSVDGALLPEQPLEAVRAGAAAGIPLLIGTTRDEWKFYGLGDPKAAQLDEEGLLRRFRRGLPGVDASGTSLAERVVETYRAARAGREGVAPTDLWFAIQTDRWFRHAAMRLAELHAAHEPATWAYLFTWDSPGLDGRLGACHALDIPFVFGAAGHPSLRWLIGDDPGAGILAERVQDAWLAFAHHGEPGHPGLPQWPVYDGGRRATMLLGDSCAVAEAPHEAERSFWDQID
jgi:para-nitrobenzyl esterase